MNGQFDFRAVLLRIQDILSENDRHRLHFLLGEDVPRYLRDDLSLSGTLRLLDSLVEKAFISDQDCNYLIEAFNKIHCHDAVRRLREYQQTQKQSNQRTFSLQDILWHENEEDKIHTARFIPDSDDPLLSSDQSSSPTDIPLKTYSSAPLHPVHNTTENNIPKFRQMKMIFRMPLNIREYILLIIIAILVLSAVLLNIKPWKKHVQCNVLAIPGIYQLVHASSNKVLDIYNGGTYNGANVQLFHNNGGENQRWIIHQNNDDTIKLINPKSGKVLDVDGTNVQIYTDNGSSSQKWRLKQVGDGVYKLINPISGKVLDIKDGVIADGTNVQIWSETDGMGQKWRLVQYHHKSIWTLIATDHAFHKCPYIEHGDSSSLTACQASCDANELCTAINYRPEPDDDCVLRQCSTYPPEAEPIPRYVAVARKPDEDDCPNFVKKEKWDYVGNNLDSDSYRITYKNCCAECTRNEKCNAFTWNPVDKRCLLKSSFGDGGIWHPTAKSGFRRISTTINGDCKGSRCGCYKRHCWAYVDEKSTDKGDWWCYTQEAGVYEKKGIWQICTIDSNCSWNRTCGDCRHYKGFEESSRTVC